MARVSDKIRKQLLNFSRRQRVGMDFLVRLIWCECKEGNPTKSKSWEDWADIEMDWYGAANGGTPDPEIPRTGKCYASGTDSFTCFNTPRRGLKREWLEAIQEFIDTHTFKTIEQAKMEIADDLLNACCAVELNNVDEMFYAPARRKKAKAERDRLLAERRGCQIFPPENGCSHGTDAYEGQH